MAYPHFLSEKEWNSFIESKSFQIVDKLTPELFLNLNFERCLYFQTTRDNAKIPYDRHQWSHSQKGSVPRHQPAYKKMIIQGCPTHAIRCTSITNSEFKKDIVHLGNSTYYHYFLTGNGTYQEPEEDQIKQPRITDNTAEQLRDLLKTEGNAKDAFEMARSQGLNVSKRQCHNQLRNIRGSSSSEPKEKVPRKKREELTMEQLDLLKHLFPNDVSVYTDANNQVHYQVKIFTSGKIDHVNSVDYNNYDYNNQYVDDQVVVKEEPIDNLDFPTDMLHFPKYEYPM